MPHLSDSEAYERYKSWMEAMGLSPADIETWRKTTEQVMEAHNWGFVQVLRPKR